MPRVLKDITINEVASVDRGAGRGVKIMLWKRDAGDEEQFGETPYWKRDFSQEQRDQAASSGAALPDGSFPIKTTEDLKNAIRLAGKAKDPAKAKAHIKSRARALGASDMIPDTWKRDSGDIDMTKEELDALVAKAVTDAVANATKDIGTALAKAQDELIVLKMTDAQKNYMAGCDEGTQKKFKAMNPDERDAYMQKNPLKKRDEPVDQTELAKRDAQIADLTKQAADQRKELDAIRLEKSQAEFKKRAADLGLKQDGDGEIMRKAYGGDVEAQTKLDARLVEVNKALVEQVKSGKLFDEFGTAQGARGKAYDSLMAKAQELRKTADGKKLTIQQAFAKVYEDPENAELVAADKADSSKRLTVVAAA